MTTTIEAVFDGTVLRLEQPLPLAPNTRVRITIEVVEPSPPPVCSFLRTARALNLDAPADFATNVDTYVPFPPGQVVEVLVLAHDDDRTQVLRRLDSLLRRTQALPQVQALTDDEIAAEIAAHRSGQ